MSLKSLLILLIFNLSLLHPTASVPSAFGSGNKSTNYTLELINQFSPNSNKGNPKCEQIPTLGYPVKVVSILNQKLREKFNPNDPNIFVRMFYYKNDNVNKDRVYKYGIEIRSFTERVYIAIVLTIPGKGSSADPEELFFMTKNAQMLPLVLETAKLDLKNALGCGDLKNLFLQASG